MYKLGKREYWVVCVVVIGLLSLSGRSLQHFIFSLVDSMWFFYVFLVVSVGLLTAFTLKQRENYPPLWVMGLSVLLLVSLVVGIFSQKLAPVESVHFVLFFLCGYLSATFGVAWGLLALFCVGVGDEVFQAFLPDRVGDLRDVAINLTSGLVGFLWRGKV